MRMAKGVDFWKFREDGEAGGEGDSQPKGDQSMMAIETLSPEGKPLGGECSALNEFHSNEPLDN